MSSLHAGKAFSAGRFLGRVSVVAGLVLALLALGLQVVPVPAIGILLAIQAFPQVLLAAALLLFVVGLVGALVSRSKKLSALLMAFVVFSGATFSVSIAGRSSAAGSHAISAVGALRILSWNTNQQDISVQQLHRVMAKTRPDVVALPEYFPKVAVGSLDELAAGYNMQIVGSENSAATLLVAKKLGKYRVVDARDTPAWAGFMARPANASAPTLLIAHLQRPSLASAATWATHVAWVRQSCEKEDNLLAVGDFNATNANLQGVGISSCKDASSSLGVGSTGTWPASIPGRLGAAIDHVMTSAQWEARSYEVLQGAGTSGSDHRPIFAVVYRRG
jgi:endonuclease/exonuclease/phosphatase (EEP) superfamily protein YafD